jgi:hypothetical protein
MTSAAAEARLSARNPGPRSGAKVVETKPVRPKRSRKITVDENEPDLIAAK